MNGSRVENSWPLAGVLLVLLLTVVVAAYHDTLLHVIDAWNQWDSGEYYAHGYLAALISLFLVFRRRAGLAQMTPCPYPPALLAVGLCSLCWLIASVTGIQLLQVAALLPMFLSVVWMVAGGRIARELVAPVLILLFAWPVWLPLPPLLQGLTADIAYLMIRLAGIPALQQEQLIILPVGRFLVEESCSGLSYLLAALTLGVLYAALNYRYFWSRLVVVLTVGVAAIVANILRVFVVVVIGHRTSMEHPVIYNHFGLGWYLFGGLVLILLLIDTRLFRARHVTESAAAGVAGKLAGVPCRQGGMALAVTTLVCGLFIAAGPVLDGWLDQQPRQELSITLELPPGQGGWHGPRSTHDTWLPVYHGAVSQLGAYRNDGHEIYLYAGLYLDQRQGSELIYELNRITDGEMWYQSHMNGRDIHGGEHRVIEQEIQDTAGNRRLVWYWYRVAGINTTNRYVAKALQVLGVVSDRPQAAVIAVAAEWDDDDAAVRRRLGDFVVQMDTSINRVLDSQSD